jgi:hypothetical protein
VPVGSGPAGTRRSAGRADDGVFGKGSSKGFIERLKAEG